MSATGEKEDMSHQSVQKDKVRTGTPRKSKAKELLLMEEFCVFCYGTPSCNDEDLEELLRCSECLKYAHPSCLEMPSSAIENSKLYNWQCNDCKGCFQCNKKTKEKCIILCDYCDRGFHTFCLEKRPTQAKKTSWRCPFCEGIDSINCVENAKLDKQFFLNEGNGPSKTGPVAVDEKLMAKRTNTSETTPENPLIKSELNKLYVENEDDSSKKERVLMSGTEQETTQSESCIASLDSAVLKRDREHSVKVRASKVELEKERSVGKYDTPEVTDSVISEVEKVTDLDTNCERERNSKTSNVGKRVLRRLSQRLSTSTVSVSPNKNDQQKDKDNSRSKAGVARENKQCNGNAIVPERIVQRRRSSRLSVLSVGNDNTPMKAIKEEKGNLKKAKPYVDTAKGIECRGASDGRENLKLSAKRHHGSVEKVSDPEEISKNMELKPNDETDLPGKEKGKQQADEVGSKVKYDEDGEKRDTVSFVHVAKRKRGRPRKYLLPQGTSSNDNKDSMHTDQVNSTQEKALKDIKNESPSRKRELRKTPNKEKPVYKKPEAEKDYEERIKLKKEEDNQRVLRKTSREPVISPTKARSILSGKISERVYPIRTELEKSQAAKRVSDTVHSNSPSKKIMKTPTKSPVQKVRKSAEKITSKDTALPSKEAKNLSTSRSDRKKPDSDLSAKKKENKPKIKVTGDSVPKRKLSFEQTPKDVKKARHSQEESQEKEADQIPKRRSMAARKEAQRTETQESDVEAFVPLEDKMLFEEVQNILEENTKKDKPKYMSPGIKIVHFGQYEIDTWYSSPYPSEFRLVGEVFVCEFCLKYMKSATILRRHMAKCVWRHPPGDEIYRKDKISVFEVDGEKSSTYCQNLCLFAKLFLDHKTLYYEVEPFLFYVMTVADCYGCHMVGYFSKEKVSFLNYNVSCILVLPQCMRKGYGKALIDFSYLLSRIEGKIGSPERPLSDLGLISYRSYWKGVLLRYLTSLEDGRVSIKELSQKTAIMSNDLISTMQYLGILKYWKGKHIILVQKEMLDAYAARCKVNRKFSLILDESNLSWTPKNYGNSNSKSKIS